MRALPNSCEVGGERWVEGRRSDPDSSLLSLSLSDLERQLPFRCQRVQRPLHAHLLDAILGEHVGDALWRRREGGAAQRAQRAASSRPLSRHPPSDLGAVGPVLLQHEREHAGVGLGEEEGMGTVGARAAARARAHQPWTPAVDRHAPCWCAWGGERRERGCAGGARAARVDAGRAEGERLTPDAGASGGRATTTSALGERAEGAGAAECGGGGGGGALSRFVFAGRCPRPTALNTARNPQC